MPTVNTRNHCSPGLSHEFHIKEFIHCKQLFDEGITVSTLLRIGEMDTKGVSQVSPEHSIINSRPGMQAVFHHFLCQDVL